MPLSIQTPKAPSPQGGFALITALSLMAFVLLLLVSITTLVRVESQTSQISKDAMTARQNALLSLQVALGKLQETLGPDQRISANGEVLNHTDNDIAQTVDNPYLVGVWGTTSGWNPGDPINYTTQKSENFIQWLISNPNSNDPRSLGFVGADFSDDDLHVELVGAGSLGQVAANLPGNRVRAPLVNIDGGDTDQIAWVVLDEGTKASINLPTQISNLNWGQPNTRKMAASGNPVANGLPFLDTLETFEQVFAGNEQSKIYSDASGALALENAGGTAEDFKGFFHELSPLSRGVLTDVVNGGLKQDLSLLAEYPDLDVTNFTPRYLYSPDDDEPSYASEPQWSYLLDYMSSYRSGSHFNPNPVGAVPELLSDDSKWATDINELLPPPEVQRLTPAIARIELVFSLIAPKGHGNGNSNKQVKAEGNTPATDGGVVYTANDSYTLYLIVSPVVTLYNPYNVPLKTESLYLSLNGIPVGFTFKRADHADYTKVYNLSKQAVPLDAFFIQPQNVSGLEKYGATYVLSLSAKNDSDDDFTLAPGETVVISPFADDSGTSISSLFDWKGNLHSDPDSTTMQGLPGYVEGAGLVYDALWPNNYNTKDVAHEYVIYPNYDDKITLIQDPAIPTSKRMNDAQVNFGKGGFVNIPIRYSDRMEVDVDLVVPHFPRNEPNKKFTLSLYDGHPNDEQKGEVLGEYRFDYGGNPATLRTAAEKFSPDAIPVNTKLTLGEELIPDGRQMDTLTFGDLIATPIAILDIFSPTTLDADISASMPWAFSNPTTFAGVNQLDEDSTFNHSYQITLRKPEAGASRDIDSENHGFAFTGLTSLDGTKYGTHFEQPLLPLQSLASLQHANLAASSYLPKVDYVVGNSFANPLLTTGKTVDFGAGVGYDLLDHSYLANAALWDTFYLSTLATYKSEFDGTAPDLATVLDNYLAGEALINPNLGLVADVDANLMKANILDGAVPMGDGFRKMAAYQYLNGAFNINSTSKNAWKALLTSLAIEATNAPPAITQDAVGGALLKFPTVDDFAFSRFRISNYADPYDSVSSLTFPIATTRSSPAGHSAWQGFRELDEAQIDDLAEAIVEEVKKRGPFLSMAEFVNHRIDTNSGDPRNLMGALDAAIEAAGLNTDLTNLMGINANLGALNLPNDSYTTESTAKGIPGYLTQADILQQIGPKLSARSDTFRVRAYGNHRSRVTGEVLSRAYCEAIVQRTPDYLDSSLESWDLPNNNPSVNDLNRRFRVVSVRWLSEDEI